jgi:hypothetical protein
MRGEESIRCPLEIAFFCGVFFFLVRGARGQFEGRARVEIQGDRVFECEFACSKTS